MAAASNRQHAVVKSFRDAARGPSTHALLDGWHLLHDARAARIAIDLVAISAEAPKDSDRALIDDLRRHATVVKVTSAAMRAISPVRTPSGIAALVQRRTCTIDELRAPAPALIVVAVDLQDPGNAGAVIRSAEAGGATGAIMAGASADPWNWKALRAAMGSTFRLPVRQEKDAAEAIEKLHGLGLRVAAAIPRDGLPIYDADLGSDAALVIGGEGAGLPPWLVARADMRISIPMAPGVESLNAAVAAGLLVYEARRQRRSSLP